MAILPNQGKITLKYNVHVCNSLFSCQCIILSLIFAVSVYYVYHTFVIDIYLNSFPNKPWFLRVCSISLFENTVEKGEIARNEQFLHLPQCFLPIWITFCHFRQIWNCCLQILLVWKSVKCCVWEWVNMTRMFQRKSIQSDTNDTISTVYKRTVPKPDIASKL